MASERLLGEVFDKYARDHPVKKCSARWEILRLEKSQRDSISKVRLSEITPKLFADWRDALLRDPSAGSVRRDMVVMSGALAIARRELALDTREPARIRQ